MRRALASLLLVLFSFPLVAPALASGTAAQLPPCCRRDGKHHCAMSPESADQDPALRSIGTKCPYFPRSTASSPNELSPAIAGNCGSLLLAMLSQRVLVRLNPPVAGSGLSRSHRKRGPPISIS